MAVVDFFFFFKDSNKLERKRRRVFTDLWGEQMNRLTLHLLLEWMLLRNAATETVRHPAKVVGP